MTSYDLESPLMVEAAEMTIPDELIEKIEYAWRYEPEKMPMLLRRANSFVAEHKECLDDMRDFLDATEQAYGILETQKDEERGPKSGHRIASILHALLEELKEVCNKQPLRLPA